MTSAQTQVNLGRAQRRSPKVGNNRLRPAVLLGDSLSQGVGDIHVHPSLEIPLLRSNVYPKYSDLVVSRMDRGLPIGVSGWWFL
jgi:hypothetical protein